MDPRCTPSITSSGPSPRASEHDPQVAAAPLRATEATMRSTL
jgi:hypothetical protein